jgi:hypothetical protein
MAHHNIKDLRHIVNNKEFHRLSRDKSLQSTYDGYKKRIRYEWVSMGDYILNKYFPELDTTTDKGKRCIDRSVFPKHEISHLCPNTFPYRVHESVDHYVLWKINGKITQKDIDHHMDMIKDKRWVDDFVAFENPTERKSIPEVEHIHVMIKFK